MKVILIQEVKGLGKKNQIVEVNDGYYKNFLARKKLAVIYTEAAAKQLQQDLNDISKKHDAQINEAKKLKDKIEKVELQFELSSKEGKAFGSISQKQIIEALAQQQIKITKYMFDNYEPLKLGKFEITLNLFETIKAKLKIYIKEK